MQSESTPPDADLMDKLDRLLAVLRSLGRCVVAFSGGIDSTVVAAAAQQALGDRAVAVTADSPSVPRAELAEARRLAELYRQIEALLPELGVEVICSGANLDDAGDYRPGLKAAAEHRVRHPLQEAGFTKADVRALARFWNLPTWDKPASPCLSSRIAPGVAVTPERTARIEAAEQLLHELGLRECRVRLHENELARLEVPPAEIPRLSEPAIRQPLTARLRQLGFRYVTIDLEGFRTGSMNELIPLQLKQQYSNSGR